MNLLRQALDENSKVSSTRLLIVITILLFIPAFVGVWVRTGIVSNAVPDIPSGVIWLIGALGTWKVGQKFAEARNGQTPAPPQTAGMP